MLSEKEGCRDVEEMEDGNGPLECVFSDRCRHRHRLQYQLSLSEDNRDKLEDKLKSVGSKAYIESRARSELLYLRPDEIRFEIENAELLDNYTPQEWNILMEQKALDNE